MRGFLINGLYCTGLLEENNRVNLVTSLLVISFTDSAVRSVSICVRERPQTFGNLANHSSPITERSRSFANKTAYCRCESLILIHAFFVNLL